MMRIVLGLVLLLGVSACGPISPEIAARQCEERARQAQGVHGKIEVGVGNRGARSRVELGVTSDFIQGRDPYEVYETCVREKSGQGPIRPLIL
ncbi:hypothetical protein [Oceaniglobus ichthyenteri]|uniref:hypothetical protein n=1 Tax=Oceaniglobus ichthyenteri TaxID=2136177 RepID=UPI001F0C9D81|nr:hypothetical protein [Oceaniglobus ichthyenteri]